MSVDSTVFSGGAGYGMLVEVDAAQRAHARGEHPHRSVCRPMRRRDRARGWVRRLIAVFARRSGEAA